MSACPPLSFRGITPSVMSCCVKAANEHGANIPDPPPPSGQVTVSILVGSFTFTWNYDSANQTATIECTDSPFIITCGEIDSALTSTVQGCGGTPA